ncbi:MAG TPA: hypothetical protein VHW05_14295 [Phenylobacterium sp.]|nr:hypothetical protein [Phenylobacterium sp.]
MTWRRPIRPSVGALVLATSLAGAGHAQPPASPQAPGLTEAKAAEGFYLDVARCLYSREHDGGVIDLPPQAKADLRPALPSERLVFKDPKTRVWTTDLYGAHVLLGELSPGKCEVIADKLPVEATFRNVIARLRSADPTLVSEPVKPVYWPIAYQLARTIEASRFTVHLEGSEAGGLGHPLRMLEGHAYPYNLLLATIERSPLPPGDAGPAACKMDLPERPVSMGPGTVQGVEDHEVSAARVVTTQQRVGGRIDPDYADTPRVLVQLDSGQTHAVATKAAESPQPGDRVEVVSLTVSHKQPCSYLPVRIARKLDAP